MAFDMSELEGVDDGAPRPIDPEGVSVCHLELLPVDRDRRLVEPVPGDRCLCTAVASKRRFDERRLA
jgi:hypothetical protein